jgi:hypothetical protein
LAPLPGRHIWRYKKNIYTHKIKKKNIYTHKKKKHSVEVILNYVSLCLNLGMIKADFQNETPPTTQKKKNIKQNKIKKK